MFLHVGNNKNIRVKDVIGIFDMDQTTISEKTRHFLNTAQKNGKIKETSFELPKSFVVCDECVYIAQPNPKTLEKRAKNIFIE